MTTTPIYQLHNLTQAYQGRVVLQIDQLDIYAGEILALVGPSGAGKSTLLRQLNFLESPTAGAMIFNGQSYGESSPPIEVRRKVVMVFQTPILLNRTVFDNVAYGLKIRGQSKTALANDIISALDKVGLTSLAQASARTLSGGEAQRVALARALVVQPDVLLLDEPTANLDPYNIKIIEQIIADSNQAGTTVVLVTHNIFQARRLAHRTALLLDSRLVEVSETPTFFESPHDPRTAAFVRGDMIY
ncbi:MAG: phosphate ABC transporter ATP-binding protein [Chloroflexota bacterium]